MVDTKEAVAVDLLCFFQQDGDIPDLQSFAQHCRLCHESVIITERVGRRGYFGSVSTSHAVPWHLRP
ncbi:hypothetical protein CEXT_498641 [Caerostris extrusa]|uniref:Uncharacterized protein n=1 Tax=Caerostris extrusa TaxID=172846 RepID=A0AAV4TJV0_CAEEX|nr:hypothetical protein CEXT_498641 [Caerostris extrusa]